jgi:DnaA N-terminal domain
MITITRKHENFETHSKLPRTVIEIGKIHFEGNVIPHTWYNYIKLPSGKTDLPAITILAEIVYWYRPTHQAPENEYEAHIVKPKKKFTRDKFSCTAAYFVNKFGITVDQARNALKRLENQGYIQREYRDLNTKQGVRLTNIMFIEPVPSKIMGITHPDTSDAPPSPQNDTLSCQNDTPPCQNDTSPYQNDTPPCQNDHTKTTTKITTKITTTTETSPNSDESGSSKLIYPKELLPDEQEKAARMLKAVNGQAQQLLDELAGQLKAKEIRNPLGYLRGLIAKARAGKFSATVGIKVGEIRKQSMEGASKPEQKRSQVWEEHREELKDIITPAEFSMNVMPLRGLEDGQALWLEAPNRFVADWVCGRMQLIEHVINPYTSQEIRVRVG